MDLYAFTDLCWLTLLLWRRSSLGLRAIMCCGSSAVRNLRSPAYIRTTSGRSRNSGLALALFLDRALDACIEREQESASHRSLELLHRAHSTITNIDLSDTAGWLASLSGQTSLGSQQP